MPTCTPPLRPSRLTLGTVQLGIAYGIANSSGQPDTATAEAILDHALAGGITTFDTARAYGSSEAVIGTWLAARSNATSPDIVTKLAPLPAATPAERRAAALASLDESRRVLGLPRLGLVLAHRENDLLDSAVIEALEMEREQGGISGYGASVYTVEAAARLLDLDRIAALQVPMSAADQRFVDSGIIARAAAAGVLVFARSAFLQGALLLPATSLPRHLAPLAPALARIAELARQHRRSISELLMLTARDTPGVASLVVGVERPEQLQPHLAAIAAPPLSEHLRAEVLHIFRGLPRETIDPSAWPR